MVLSITSNYKTWQISGNPEQESSGIMKKSVTMLGCALLMMSATNALAGPKFDFFNSAVASYETELPDVQHYSGNQSPNINFKLPTSLDNFENNLYAMKPLIDSPVSLDKDKSSGLEFNLTSGGSYLLLLSSDFQPFAARVQVSYRF
jgi:hypothetical protein